MAQQPMYAAVVNSPLTELAANVTVNATSITVVNAAMLPPAPNLLTIGSDDTAETVRYTAISGNVLTVVRGFQGTAKEWNTGAKVARYYTAYDHNTFVSNISDVVTQLGTKETPAGAQDKADAALNAAKLDATTKANIAGNNALNASISRTTNLVVGDWNAYKANGIFEGTQMVNAPLNSDQWFRVFVMNHSYDPTNYCSQLAFSFDSGELYTRTLNAGIWKPWVRVLNGNDYNTLFQYASDGKNVIANAITGKGVPASRDETHQQLADKVSQIHTGKKSATVNVTFNTNQVDRVATATIPNLGFTPTIAIMTNVYINNVDNTSGAITPAGSSATFTTLTYVRMASGMGNCDVELKITGNILTISASIRFSMNSATRSVYFIE